MFKYSALKYQFKGTESLDLCQSVLFAKSRLYCIVQERKTFFSVTIVLKATCNMYGIGNERQICNLGLFYPIYELTGGGGVISFCPSRGSHSPEPHSGSRTASKGPTGSCIIHPG